MFDGRTALQWQQHSLNWQLRRSSATVQQLTVQVNQANANLSMALAALEQVRQEVLHRRIDLDGEREQHAIAKKSLDYEFFKHAETENDLAHARHVNQSLTAVLDTIRPSREGEETDVPLESLRIGSLVKEKLELQRALAAKGSQLEDCRRVVEIKERTLQGMEEDRNAKLENLEQQEREIKKLRAELYEFVSDDDESDNDRKGVGDLCLGKRKRAADEG